MTPTESLILDAKQAILEEQHRRFQDLHREGRWQEAMEQFKITLVCASDLLNYSLNVLDRILAARRTTGTSSHPADTPSILKSE